MANAKALQIELPDGERGRGENEIRRLDKLLAKLSRKDLSESQRKDAERELHALETAPRESADKAWRDRTAKETADLAELRGETVDARAQNPLRIMDRDPAEFLFSRGHLTPDQRAAAVTMRDAYETRSEGVGSQLGAMTSLGGAHNNDHFVRSALDRAKRLQIVGTVERAVMLSDAFREASISGPSVVAAVGLQILRGVCGEGKSLSSYGMGRAYERHLKALKIALDVAHKLTAGARAAGVSMISLGEMNARPE